MNTMNYVFFFNHQSAVMLQILEDVGNMASVGDATVAACGRRLLPSEGLQLFIRQPTPVLCISRPTQYGRLATRERTHEKMTP